MTTTYLKQVLLRRGNTAVSSTYTGPVGEITIDTDLETIRVHDGITPGGRLATSSYSGTTPPSAPRENMLWYDTTGGRLYVYYSGAWVDASPAGDQELNANVAQLFQDVVSVELHITSLDANIGAFETAVSDTFNNFENVINANIGAFETNVTSTVNTINSNINTLNQTIMGFEGNAGPTSAAWTSDNPPDISNVGALWYDDVSGRLYVYYDSTWVDASPPQATNFGNVLPSANVAYSLGSADYQWKELWVSGSTIYLNSVPLSFNNGNLTVDGNPVVSYVDGNLSAGGTVISGGGGGGAVDLSAVAQDIVPSDTVQYNLGSPARRWKDLYLSGSTIDLGGTVLSADGNGGLIIPGGISSVGGVIVGFTAGSGTVSTNQQTVTFDPAWDPGYTLDPVFTGPQHNAYDTTGNAGTDAVFLYNKTSTAINSITLVSGGSGYPDLIDTGVWYFSPAPAEAITITGVVNPLDFPNNSYLGEFTSLTLSDYQNPHTATITIDGDVWSITYRLAQQGRGGYSYVAAETTVTCNGSAVVDPVKLSKLANGSGMNGLYVHRDNFTILRLDGSADVGDPAILIMFTFNKQWPSETTVALAIDSAINNTQGTTNIIGQASVSGDLTVTGDLTLSGSLTVSPDSIFMGEVTLTAPTNNFNISTSGNDWSFGTDGTLILPGSSGQIGISGYTNGIDLYNNNGTGYVRMNYDDQSYVWADASGAHIQAAGTYTWDFATDGKLTAPGKIQITDTTNSINTTTGALIVAGGVGIQSDVHIGGTLNITDTTPSTDYTTGALVVSGGVGVNGNINLTGNINITNGNINIQEFNGSTGNFYGDIVTGFNAFYAGKSGFTPLPYTVAQFSTASNSYSQINMENISTGKLASVDFVGTGDIGDDANWFFDIGIANSGYDPVLAAENNALGTAIGPLDAYYYVQGNASLPNTGGNLAIGTSNTGKVVKFFAGGVDTTDVILTIGESGVVVTQNLTAPNMAYAADVAAANAAIVTANTGVVSYANTLNSAMLANVTAANAAIVTANTAMKSYVDSRPTGSTYSNTNVAAYLSGSITTGNIAIAANFGNIVFNNGAHISGNVAGREGSILLSPAASGTFPGVMIGGAGRLLAPNGSVHQIFNASDVTFQVPIKTIVGTVSTSTTTGALIVTGGAGFSGNIYAGGLASVTGNITGGNITTAGQISATGNVITSGKFVGDGSSLTNVTVSVAGNIQGSGTNVNLVAGNYTYTFDNTGIVTLPAPATGNEGGEIDFTKAANSSLLGTSVVVDQYIDRLRFFESGGTSRGAYIDLTQAAAGVGTLLNNRVSGFVNAGTFVTMDNIKATVTTSGSRGLSLATVSGTVTGYIAGQYLLITGAPGGNSVGVSLSTTPTSSILGFNFPGQGDTSYYTLRDDTNNRVYRITLIIGSGYSNNFISFERLV